MWGEFISWVSELNRGCSDPSSSILEISDSVTVGERGLVARQSVPKGARLMSLKADDPRLVLTPRRAIDLLHCCSCFVSKNLSPVTIEPQDTLALFFYHLRQSDENCDLFNLWRPYYDVLPKYFTDVAYVSVSQPEKLSKIISYAPSEVHIEFMARVNRLKCSFRRITGSNKPVNMDFAWAWSLVNSRCVYLDLGSRTPTKSVFANSRPPPKKWLQLRSNADANIAIVPFFDFFNHSPNVNVNIDVTNGEVSLASDSAYSVGEQAFINYGKHSNLFLLCEYGFSIPGELNHCDTIHPTYRNILSISPCPTRLHKVLEDLHIEWSDHIVWNSVYLERVGGPSYYLVLLLHANFSDTTLTTEELYCLDETVRSPGVLRGLRLLLRMLLRECDDALTNIVHFSPFVEQLVQMLTTRKDMLRRLLEDIK